MNMLRPCKLTSTWRGVSAHLWPSVEKYWPGSSSAKCASTGPYLLLITRWLHESSNCVDTDRLLSPLFHAAISKCQTFHCPMRPGLVNENVSVFDEGTGRNDGRTDDELLVCAVTVGVYAESQCHNIKFYSEIWASVRWILTNNRTSRGCVCIIRKSSRYRSVAQFGRLCSRDRRGWGWRQIENVTGKSASRVVGLWRHRLCGVSVVNQN